MLPLPFEYEYDRLKTIYTCYDDERDQWKLTGMARNTVYQIPQIPAGSRKDDRSKKVNKDHESHAKAAKPTKIFEPDQLGQVVNCGIDPASSLR